MKDQEKALIEAGCENVKGYVLVNNYGFTFTKNGTKYDLRHWLNVYGADVDYWDISHVKGTFKSFEEALEAIKKL
mgnify:CR=1 FL=1